MKSCDIFWYSEYLNFNEVNASVGSFMDWAFLPSWNYPCQPPDSKYDSQYFLLKVFKGLLFALRFFNPS